MRSLQSLQDEFGALFSAAPAFFRGPGRVNLIGEHTDYNAGLVMPMAITFDTKVGISARSDRRLKIRSTHFNETRDVAWPGRDDPIPRLAGQQAAWIDYVIGVIRALDRHGIHLGGANILLHSEVPLGAGLSSSAALEVAVALGLLSIAGQILDPVTLATLCQQAENDYVGMRCGIMDQLVCTCGRAGHALKIDCRSLTYECVPLELRGPHALRTQIVVCNTQVHHRHAGGAYNRRREECEEGVAALRQVMPQVMTLRDVTPAELLAHETALDPLIYRRCRHVVTENDRVVAAAQALRSGAFDDFGKLMGESHVSLRDDYEVSCSELDLMVGLANSIEGVLGARMTGGGFGGCTVNLVLADAVPGFEAQIREQYAAATGHTPEIYVCEAADGAGPLQNDAGRPGGVPA